MIDIYFYVDICMNYCLNVCFIKLCCLTLARISDGFQEPTKGLMKPT